PNVTIRYTDPRATKPPPDAPRPVTPVTPVYQVSEPVVPPGSQFGQQQPSVAQPPAPPPGPVTPERKSKVVWWILGGLVALGLIGVGIVIVVIILAGMGSNSNANANRANVNSRGNRNANSNANANVSNTNTNANLPALLTDDFSEKKWGTGNYAFGDIWYADDQYHMRSKAKTYLVMYAPSSAYNTGDATVSVTARSVDGTPAASGFGLIVHCEKSKSGQLEDYALLIYTGDQPKYEI